MTLLHDSTVISPEYLMLTWDDSYDPEHITVHSLGVTHTRLEALSLLTPKQQGLAMVEASLVLIVTVDGEIPATGSNEACYTVLKAAHGVEVGASGARGTACRCRSYSCRHYKSSGV